MHFDVADVVVSFHLGKDDNIHIIAYIAIKGSDQFFMSGFNEKEKFHGHLNAGNGKTCMPH